MDGSLVYSKTPKGVAEVAARSAQLSMTTRRVLIMIDGKRSIDELAVLLRPGEIDAVITQLESAGLIQRSTASHPLDVPTVAGREMDCSADHSGPEAGEDAQPDDARRSQAPRGARTDRSTRTGRRNTRDAHREAAARSRTSASACARPNDSSARQWAPPPLRSTCGLCASARTRRGTRRSRRDRRQFRSLRRSAVFHVKSSACHRPPRHRAADRRAARQRTRRRSPHRCRPARGCCSMSPAARR